MRGVYGGAEDQFTSWELAVRHEAACYETHFHYLRICDGVDEEECERRVARIAELAGTIERLRSAERIIRPLLPARVSSRRLMADCPWPEPYEAPGDLPPDPLLEALAASCRRPDSASRVPEGCHPPRSLQASPNGLAATRYLLCSTDGVTVAQAGVAPCGMTE